MRFGILAAAVAMLAPVAEAQDCGPLHSVIRSGMQDGFESIAGKKLEPGFYEPKIIFFGSEECAIDALVGEYYCLWDRPTVADADKVIAQIYDLAKVCLSGGWDWTEITGRKTGATTAITEGYRMAKTSGADKGAAVEVYMNGTAGEPWRQVGLAVTLP